MESESDTSSQERPERAPPLIYVVTGESGAGKSTALRVLEDHGYFCVDNLPAALAPGLVALAEGYKGRGLAFGVDVRLERLPGGNDAIGAVGRVIDDLRKAGHNVCVLFCSASAETLVRRFSETRRPHPMGVDLDLLEAIRREGELLAPLRARADLVVDTSGLNVHDLRRRLVDSIGPSGGPRPMLTRVVSFGFKYGIPVDADLVFDVRYLPNPYFVPALKPRTGQDPEVAAFVLDTPETEELLQLLLPLLVALLPRYEREGKALLTVAIGCTGGRHRSVAIAEELARRLGEGTRGSHVVVHHRDAAGHG